MQTLSKAEGIGGTIKQDPEDFVVEEIMKNGKVLELDRTFAGEELGLGTAKEDAKFTVFIMQKRDWNTAQALKVVARRVRRGIKSAGFAGTKDRASVSTQLCSMFGAKPEEMLGIHVKDIKINGAWRSNEQVRLGDLLGNRFTIRIKDVQRPDNIEKINGELNGLFPNYFGGQRFGYRNNNVEIGLDMIKGDFESAVERFLTDTTNEKNEEAVNARIRLKDEHDYAKALDYFPQFLKYERQVIEQLAKVPTDPAGALRRLPRTLTLMFVHSVDSYIFNKEIERRLGDGHSDPQDGDLLCGTDAYGFPDTDNLSGKEFVVGNIVGYDNTINSVEKEILDELGITQEQFRVKSMPELNCKGARRALFAPYKDFSYEKKEDSIEMRFSLPAGSYATVFLNEFMKAQLRSG